MKLVHQPKSVENMSDFKLCYIDGDFAYFTKLPLREQWGDDWDDAHYEGNAGTPYCKEGQKILRIAFKDADLDTPDGEHCVERINQGVVPWLCTPRWSSQRPIIKIFAGATPMEFKNKVRAAGGVVFTQEDND